jgi:hypothetical protein
VVVLARPYTQVVHDPLVFGACTVGRDLVAGVLTGGDKKAPERVVISVDGQARRGCFGGLTGRTAFQVQLGQPARGLGSGGTPVCARLDHPVGGAVLRQQLTGGLIER